MLNAEGQYVLFVCEGVAEQYILTTLIERGELTVPNELIVPNQLRGTWYFTRKESKRMLDRFLNMSYGKHPLLIIRIVRLGLGCTAHTSRLRACGRGREPANPSRNRNAGHHQRGHVRQIHERLQTAEALRLLQKRTGHEAGEKPRMAGTILGRVRLPRACVLRCSCRLPTRSTSRRGCVPCPSSMPSCTHP